MARPSNADLQKTWNERIQKAKKCKQDWMDQFQVQMGRDYFAGMQNPGYPDDEWITINKIYSHLMAQLPTLYNVDPYFYIKVKKSYTIDPKQIVQFQLRAKIRQAYLNYLKGELDMKSKARLGIQDAHFAFGILKSRYAADEQENPDKGKTIKSETQLNAEGEQMDLVDEEGVPLVEPDFIPINERYEMGRVHPDDFIWDEDAGPLDDKWTWCAERIKKTREQAKKDKRLNRRVVNALNANSKDKEKEAKGGLIKSLGSFFTTATPEPTKEKRDEDLLIFWEIYDIENKQWLMIAEDGDAPVVKPTPLPKGVEDHPYSILRFTLMDDTPYPIPPVSQAMDPQKEFCLTRSRTMTHRKRFNRKYEVNMNALVDETEADKLESGDDGTIIRKNGPQQAVFAVQDAPLDQQNLIETQALARDITEIFGSPGEALGIAAADSATQADIMNQRLNVREGDRMSMVIDWIVTAAKKLDQIVQANITRDEAVKITGPEGEFWELVRVEDFEAIDGEFEYSVNVGAMTPQLPDVERSQWLAFMSQVVIPMPHILTAPSFMKKMAQMYHIEDEASLEELRQIGLKMLSGQMPMPGGGAGGGPESAALGTALGLLGGNTNGGGAPGGMES